MQTKELQLKTEINRKRLVEVIFKAKAGHIGVIFLVLMY